MMMDDNPYRPPVVVEPRGGQKPKNRLTSVLACLTIASLVAAAGLLAVIVLFIVALSFSNM
jgi:hypothetical protein